MQLEPLQGKLDPCPLEKSKMADSNKITLNPVVQAAEPQSVLPGGSSEIIPICRNTGAGGGESRCSLWEGRIIDATFPPV